MITINLETMSTLSSYYKALQKLEEYPELVVGYQIGSSVTISSKEDTPNSFTRMNPIILAVQMKLLFFVMYLESTKKCILVVH